MGARYLAIIPGQVIHGVLGVCPKYGQLDHSHLLSTVCLIYPVWIAFVLAFFIKRRAILNNRMGPISNNSPEICCYFMQTLCLHVQDPDLMIFGIGTYSMCIIG
eukprot:1143154-Pelagomonas_calceolata.AAC.2